MKNEKNKLVVFVGDVIAQVDGLALEFVHQSLVDMGSVFQRDLKSRPTDCLGEEGSNDERRKKDGNDVMLGEKDRWRKKKG